MRWLLAAFAAVMFFAIIGMAVSIGSDDPFVGIFGIGATTFIVSRLLRLLALAFIFLIVIAVVTKLVIAARHEVADGHGDAPDPIAQATVDAVRKGYGMYSSLSPDQKAAVNKALVRGFWAVIGATRDQKASRKILELREAYDREKRRIG